MLVVRQAESKKLGGSSGLTVCVYTTGCLHLLLHSFRADVLQTSCLHVMPVIVFHFLKDNTGNLPFQKLRKQKAVVHGVWILPLHTTGALTLIWRSS